jgi:hypothetical protein
MRPMVALMLLSTLPLLVLATFIDSARMTIPGVAGIAIIGGLYCYLVRAKPPASG